MLLGLAGSQRTRERKWDEKKVKDVKINLLKGRSLVSYQPIRGVGGGGFSGQPDNAALPSSEATL